MKTISLLLLTFSVAATGISQIIKPPKQIWATCYDAAPNFITVTDQVTDKLGNTYVTGAVSDKKSSVLTRFFLKKYDEKGFEKWEKNFPAADSFDIGKALALDNDGNIYVTGDRFNIACTECDVPEDSRYIFIMEYDPDGNMQWLTRETTSNADHLLLYTSGIAVADYGSVYISGNEYKFNRRGYVPKYRKAFVAKMNSKGAESWTRRVDNVYADAITYDKDKSVYVCGNNNETLDTTNETFFVIKFAANGAVAWSQKFNETGRWGSAEFVSTDDVGNVYIHGGTNNTAGTAPYVVTVKYDANGTQQWYKKESQGTVTKRHVLGDFIADKEGFVSIGCTLLDEYTLSDTSSNNNWYLSAYNTDGNKQWSVTYDDSLGLDDNIASIKTDGRHNVYVAGTIAYKYVQRGKSFLSTYAIARYDSQGEQLWVQNYNSKPNDNTFAIGLGLDAKNSLYVSGYSLSDNMIQKMCTVKFAKKGGSLIPSVSAETAAENIISSKPELSPNPCYNNLTLNMAAFSSSIHTAKIFDANGKMYVQASIQPSAGKLVYNFNTSDLLPGIYLMQVTDGKKSVTKKFIKN